MWLVRLEVDGLFCARNVNVLEPHPLQTLIYGILLLKFKLECHLESNKLIFHYVGRWYACEINREEVNRDYGNFRI